MVSSLALCDETLVSLNERLGGFLDFPLADVAERLTADGSLLGSLRRGPSARPVVSELLKEWSLDFCWLSLNE